MDSVCETSTSAGPWAQWHWHHIIKDPLALQEVETWLSLAPGGKVPSSWARGFIASSIPILGTEHLLGLWPGQHEELLTSKTNMSFGKGSDIPLNTSSSAVPLECTLPKNTGLSLCLLQCRRPIGNWGLRLLPPAMFPLQDTSINRLTQFLCLITMDLQAISTIFQFCMLISL